MALPSHKVLLLVPNSGGLIGDCDPCFWHASVEVSDRAKPRVSVCEEHETDAAEDAALEKAFFFPFSSHSASFTNIPESQHRSFTRFISPDSSLCRRCLCFGIRSPPFRATRAHPQLLNTAWPGH